jgi:hypothetical protein
MRYDSKAPRLTTLLIPYNKLRGENLSGVTSQKQGPVHRLVATSPMSPKSLLHADWFGVGRTQECERRDAQLLCHGYHMVSKALRKYKRIRGNEARTTAHDDLLRVVHTFLQCVLRPFLDFSSTPTSAI